VDTTVHDEPWTIQFLIHVDSRQGSLSGRSALRNTAAYTGNHKYEIKTQINIHTSSGIRTRDPNVFVGKDSSYLRTGGPVAQCRHIK
jgi:hypothetical protein